MLSKLILRDMYGFSYADIADRNRVAEGTVKSRLSRGRELLQEKLRQARIM